MATNLSNLSNQALVNYKQIYLLQELLEICVEQGEQPLEKKASRVDLLVRIYLEQVDLYLEGLGSDLELIRQVISNQA